MLKKDIDTPTTFLLKQGECQQEIALGISSVMDRLYNDALCLAKKTFPVLITGPTGSGKEWVANILHTQGYCPDEQFLDINCGALNESLIESLLFGHEKGSFTGANNKQDGYFKQVGKGTIFLDEIGELPLHLQPKLLRILENRTFRPLGSHKSIAFEGRVVAATHCDLEKMVQEGTFREDLFHRLNVLNLQIPPLSERREDIPYIIDVILKRSGNTVSFSDEALQLLIENNWPGNIRQLKNTIELITAFTTTNVVDVELINQYAPSQKDKTTIEEKLDKIAVEILRLDIDNKLSAIEKATINKAMEQSAGNKTKAAKLIGVHRKVVERRLNSAATHIDTISSVIEKGTQHMTRSNYIDAAHHYKQAYELLNSSSESDKTSELQFDLYLKIGVCLRSVHGWGAPELPMIYDKAKKAGSKLKKHESLATVRFGEWINHLMNLNMEKAYSVALQLLNDGKEASSPYTISLAYTLLANTDFWRGNFVQAEQFLTNFSNLYNHKEEPILNYGLDPFVHNIMFCCLNSFQLGNIESSVNNLSTMLDYIKGSNHPFSIAVALQAATWIEYKMGNSDKSYKYALKLINLSRKNGFTFYEGVGMMFAGAWTAENVDSSEGIETIKNAYHNKIVKDGGKMLNSIYALMLGTIYLADGNISEGLKIVHDALNISLTTNELCYYSDLLILLSELYLRQDDIENSKRYINDAIAVAKNSNSLTAELKATIILSSIEIAEYSYEQAENRLRTILEKFSITNKYQKTIEAENLLTIARVHISEDDDKQITCDVMTVLKSRILTRETINKG